MPQQTIHLRVNPSDETIRLGPLAVRFLITGDDATGSVAVFELTVPARAASGGAGAQPRSLRGDDLRDRRRADLDRRRTPDRRRAGAGALHSARRRSPVRQHRQPGRQGALRDHAGRDRSGVFPRGCRGDRRGGRRSAGPGKDGRSCSPTDSRRPRRRRGVAREAGPRQQHRGGNECTTSCIPATSGRAQSPQSSSRASHTVPVFPFSLGTYSQKGPRLHKHPYAETCIVRSGGRRWVVEETVTAGAGDIVVIGPATPHRFTAMGDERPSW